MADGNFDNLTVNGHVGIGTTAPHGTLDVKTTADQHLVFNANGNASDPGAFGIVATNDADNAFVPLNLSASRFAFTMGYVGIGTTAPHGTLDVKTAADQHLVFNANGNASDPGAFGIVATNDADNAFVPLNLSASRFAFTTGYVGIGTTTPGAMLDVGGVYSGTLHVANGTAGAFQIIGIGNTGNLILNNANTVGGDIDIQARGKSALCIKAGGNVGIGTASPSAKLNVDPEGPGGIVIGNPSTGAGGHTSLSLSISAESGGASTIQSIKASGTTWGELHLNPYGGNVGIGTAPTDQKLTVAGVVESTSGGFKFPDGSLVQSMSELVLPKGVIINTDVAGGGQIRVLGPSGGTVAALGCSNQVPNFGAMGVLNANSPVFRAELCLDMNGLG